MGKRGRSERRFIQQHAAKKSPLSRQVLSRVELRDSLRFFVNLISDTSTQIPPRMSTPFLETLILVIRALFNFIYEFWFGTFNCAFNSAVDFFVRISEGEPPILVIRALVNHTYEFGVCALNNADECFMRITEGDEDFKSTWAFVSGVLCGIVLYAAIVLLLYNFGAFTLQHPARQQQQQQHQT